MAVVDANASLRAAGEGSLARRASEHAGNGEWTG